MRLIASHHDACDGDTRVRLPRTVPSRAVRRVVCDRCAEPYEPTQVQDVAEPGSRLRVPSPSVSWTWLRIPVAGVAVVAVLYALQAGEDPSAPAPPVAPVERDGDVGSERAAGKANVPGDAQLVSESTFQLALPGGWERIAPSGGATFAAAAPGGEADVMLWIERDPKLDFATFEARSLTQLESLAGSAGTVERNPGPTPEATSLRIAPTSAPDGAPNYEVLLRASGPLWYYLATTSQPGAGAAVTDAVELIQGSFLPQGAGR